MPQTYEDGTSQPCAAAVARGRKPAWSRALVVDCRSLSRALGTLATQKVEGSSPFIRLAFKPIPSNTGCARQALEAKRARPTRPGEYGERRQDRDALDEPAASGFPHPPAEIQQARPALWPRRNYPILVLPVTRAATARAAVLLASPHSVPGSTRTCRLDRCTSEGFRSRTGSCSTSCEAFEPRASKGPRIPSKTPTGLNGRSSCSAPSTVKRSSGHSVTARTDWPSSERSCCSGTNGRRPRGLSATSSP